jgi:hypothetical protein
MKTQVSVNLRHLPTTASKNSMFNFQNNFRVELSQPPKNQLMNKGLSTVNYVHFSAPSETSNELPKVQQKLPKTVENPRILKLSKNQ